MRQKETVTLHFDLSGLPQEKVFTLNAGDSKHYNLLRYSDFPGKIDEHRNQNKALALIPSDQMDRITHFVEDAEFYSEGLSLRSVVYPPDNSSQPLPDLAMPFIYIPAGFRRQAIKRFPSRSYKIPHPVVLHRYGVPPEAVVDDFDGIRFDVGAIMLPPIEIAKTIVFNHPEIGTANPVVAQYVLETYFGMSQHLQDLMQFVEDNPMESTNAWCQVTYVTYLDAKGDEQTLEPNTALVDKNKQTINWPTDPGSQTLAIPQYSLSNSGTSTTVIDVATPVVQQILTFTKNDAELNGHLWTKQNGTTQKTQTNASPVPTAKRAGFGDAVGNGQTQAYSLKDLSSSYGLDVYPDRLAYDQNSNTVSFPVRNFPSRYLAAYVQFLQSDGTAINRQDITGWQDSMPDDLQSLFEPSSTKNFLSLISAGNQVLGVPWPTNPVTLEFIWPQEATKAEILIGGLGCLEGFSDWDNDVDVAGTVGTCLICFGLGVMGLLFTVYLSGPIIAWVSGSAAIWYAIIAAGAALGVVGLIYGLIEHDTDMGKYLLAKITNFVTGLICGNLLKLGLKQVYADEIGQMQELVMGSITADEALEQLPYAGWAMTVMSITASLESLAATTVECVLSPATYRLEVLYSMDLTVTVGPDPNHAAPGQQPIWPVVSDHYVISAAYPKSPTGDGGTTYVMAGPMPGDSTAPITVTFQGIPAGGQVDVTADIYSENNWLAGHWDGGWVNATPDISDQMSVSGNIVETLVPLTSTTTYSQKQFLNYDTTQEKHLWEVTKFSIAASLSTDLNSLQLTQNVSDAFQANGNTLSSADQVTISVNTVDGGWTLTDKGTGRSYSIIEVQVYDSGGTQLSELSVQDTTNVVPSLPSVLADCTTDGDNHNICSLVNMTINNKNYELGYTWQASGQNMPLDGGSTNVNDQMFTFQSISTLGEPEDSIIEPTQGFSQQSFLAFDQFGLTPLFYLPLTPFQAELNAGGQLSADLNQAFANYSLPQGAEITVVTSGSEWSIGVPNQTPLYDLKVVSAIINGQAQNVINIYGYPLPALDNFYLDPRSFPTDGLYHLRGIEFPGGQSNFDYSSDLSWGAFSQASLNALAVHPRGYVVGVDFDNHKLLTLQLPPQAVADADAPPAMILSGQGTREGLMQNPVSMTITADGRILVLEQGNARVQAFDVKGNPVACFAGPVNFAINASFTDELNSAIAETDLVQAFQQNVTPACAPLFDGPITSVADLNNGTVDTDLLNAFATYAYTLPTDASQISVTATQQGQLWLITDNVKNVTYDVRLVTDETQSQFLYVYYCFVLNITVNASGLEWTIADSTNAMTFAVTAPTETNGGSTDLTVQQLVAIMPLRQVGSSVTYMDIAVEPKGYIYVLFSVVQSDGTTAYQLDIYNPDGTTLLEQPQSEMNAAKMTVDQWRSLYTLNFYRVLGPGARTEPGISTWMPSTPGPPSGS